MTQFLSDESGLSAMEYALLGGAIGLLLVVSLGGIGGKLNSLFYSANDGMS
jgi:Flp pilus assembly pilin Flp